MTLKKALIFGVILELLLGVAAGAFYFKFYIYTPTYSIKAMQKAMQSGDTQALQQLADLNAIFKDNSIRLSELVPKNDPVYTKLKDGSFGDHAREEFLTYVETGEWPEEAEVTPETSFEDKIGLRTMSFRSLEYIYRDPPPGAEEQKEVAWTDKALELGMYLFNRVTGTESTENAEQQAVEVQAEDGPIIVTAGVRVYEPNYGDTFILQLKLKRQDDGTWLLYDVANYAEFADALIKQNDRDYVRYKEKVRMLLTSAQEKFNELHTRQPELNNDWMFEARKIMEESNEQIDELKVPVAGAYLNHLLKERKEIFLSMLDAYYEVNVEKDNMQAAKDRAAEAQKKGKRRPTYNETVWNNRISKATGNVDALQKSWAENKVKLEEVVGAVIDRTDTANKAARAMRNNDDAAVRAANYPGVENAGDAQSLLGGENLPTISAYGNQAQ